MNPKAATAKKEFYPSEKIRKSKKYQAAKKICTTLQENKFAAYLVGGAVRDMLICPNKLPKDLDIATSALPEQLFKLFPNANFVGETFGVCVVNLDGWTFEVATFRTEGKYLDRRHPEFVKQGTMEQDSDRRDFTVNSLYLDPVNNKIIDLHGGQQDLQKKIIRCVGEPYARLQEDVLRVLRLCRFAANLNFTIEPNTEQAATKTFPDLNLLSKERIILEFAKVHNGKFFDFVRLILSYGKIQDVLNTHDYFTRSKKLNSSTKLTTDTNLPLFNFIKTLFTYFETDISKTELLTTEIAQWPISSKDRMISTYFLRALKLQAVMLETNNALYDFLLYELLLRMRDKDNENIAKACSILIPFIKIKDLKGTIRKFKTNINTQSRVDIQVIIAAVQKLNLDKRMIAVTKKYLDYLHVKHNYIAQKEEIASAVTALTQKKIDQFLIVNKNLL